ncbi:CAP domain-containing protein [Haloarchaeobius sp. TZWWS8]|uniref:CAP domain-containing protein n=1 Tax=Haloarchaeobius sp. TZWWS8 TaxID=3446121 RepID=UPI003EBF11C7
MRRSLRSLFTLALSALVLLQAGGVVDLQETFDSVVDDGQFDPELPSPRVTDGPGTASGPDSDGARSQGGGQKTGESRGTPTVAPRADIDVARLERLVHGEVNEVRTSRGLEALERDAALAEIARYHGRDMAQNEYVAHTAPDGETMSDRYDAFGYDCRVSTGDGRYASGGENIYYARYTGYDYTEAELARMTVDGWMNSTGHRENLLRDYWNREGIGVVVDQRDGRTHVYVTQNFC